MDAYLRGLWCQDAYETRSIIAFDITFFAIVVGKEPVGAVVVTFGCEVSFRGSRVATLVLVAVIFGAFTLWPVLSNRQTIIRCLSTIMK